ncbi:uncharacterized protein LOC128552893 [Mercenaria mercenaria]|uniref:uncharacterized protein LOC128552893 n=1 Tax=Mercenaria mercenaria TaxID=6596 RepID=UPI00234ED6A3|nr:uncharacterized protein LOC128552893 [Mercenaria mercenaria]
MIVQRIEWHGELCLQLVDDLLCWFTDMRNIPDAKPGIAGKGSIRIPIKCSSMKGMLKHLEYMDSDECKQRLSEISCSLSKMLGFSCCLSWTIVPDSLQKVTKTLSEELKTMKIVLPFENKSLEGLTNMWTFFEGEGANRHLTKISETLSKIVRANVSLTASVDLDQFTKAVCERSKDNISSSIDTKVQGQEQLGNIQDSENISDKSIMDEKDAAQGTTEMDILPSSESFIKEKMYFSFTTGYMAQLRLLYVGFSLLISYMTAQEVDDIKRRTEKELQTIIEAKCDQRQKKKKALALLFKFVEMIQNRDHFSKEEINQTIEQRIRYHGDLCLRLVDDLLQWFGDIRDIPDAEHGIIAQFC